MTGGAFYQTSRTIAVPTVLRFHLIFHEYRERFAKDWPPHAVLEADFSQRAAAALNRLELDEVVRSYDDAMAMNRNLAERFLADAGISLEQLATPAANTFLDHYATIAIRAQGHREPPSKPRPRFAPEDRDFSFDRALVQRAIVGAYIGPGKGDRTATAHFLNRGLPNGKRGINYSQVRNALDGFVRLLTRRAGDDMGHWDIAGLLCAHELQLSYLLWKHLGGTPGKSGVHAERALLALIDSGEVHQVSHRLFAQLGFPPKDPARVLPLIEHKIGMLRRAKKRLDRIAKAAPVSASGNATHRAAP